MKGLINIYKAIYLSANPFDLRMIKHLITTIFLCLYSIVGISDNIGLTFKHLSKNDGLSANEILTIYQDSDGFTWIGTVDGLNKYDGYDFQVFRNINGDSSSIINNVVRSIIEDPDENILWIGTAEGLTKFRKDTQSFEPSSIINEGISSLFVDSSHNLWICTDNGNVFLKERGKLSIAIYEPLKDYNLNKILVDSKGNFWVTEARRMGLFDPHTGKINYLIEEIKVDHLIESAEGHIWVGAKHEGLYKIENGNTQKITRYGKKEGYFIADNISGIVEISPGKYWVAIRDGGLYLLDEQNNTCEGYFYDIHNPNGLSTNAITSIYRDNLGNLWLGTFNKGINFLDHWKKAFVHYKFNFKANGLPNNNIRSIYQDRDGDIWIGTKEGGSLSKFDPLTGTFIHYSHKKNDSNSISDDFILSIHDAHPGYLWVGTLKGGLNLFNKSTGKFIHFKTDKYNPQSIVQNAIYSLIRDRENQLWIGTGWKGLDLLKTEKGPFLHLPSDPKIDGSLPHKGIRAIFETKDHQIWIGTKKGLSVYESTTGTFKTYKSNPKDVYSIGNENIICLYEDSRGNFWVGTQNGLFLMDRKTEKFIGISEDDGLPSNTIIGILEDDHGNLWLSTSNGISKFTPSTHFNFNELSENLEKGTFRNFGLNDGLQGNEFEQNAFFRLKDGRMLFGGGNGFNIFHPDSIKDNPNVPEVRFTDFRIFNKKVEIGNENSPLNQAIGNTESITLAHTDHTLTFHFTALNYSSPEKNQYAYKLDGLEEDWNLVGNQRFATYTNLSPGKYIFQVKASNNDGLWNEKGIELEITILPPWWETWWFRITVILLVVGLALTYYRRKTLALKRRQEELERQVVERTSEVVAQKNEIQAQAEELHQQAEELQTQRDHLEGANQAITQKNQMITDSINYASRIQQAILPSEEMLNTTFSDHFVLFKPKDIVSGDFYWMAEIEGKTFVAAVDCTGHGVPGAFMSLIGSSLLNRLVKEQQVFAPSVILQKLDQGVREILKQKDGHSQDGMDMALCVLEKKNGEIEVKFSGAKSDLFYKKKGDHKIKRLKGTRTSIGGRFDKEKYFHEHEFQLSEGDQIYLATDGIIDQSNVERQRFGSKKLIESFIEAQNLEMQAQLHSLEKHLASHQQQTEQRDDITVIGLKI
ncbi:two-component regulator propeller domain-containing protein [Flexithrix dorotheae]|uniref:two-component regulator propeller domain-containing protein n=1 Tax=Flexithrix dorotheae TaxID=70993 RepID=UPI000363E8A8|nr:two-component regulator propeller domain-containing protein [Flexithrix dorotheae]